MPTLTRRFGAPRPALAAVLTAALVSTTLWVAGTASAAPSPQEQLAQKQSEATALQSKIDANGMRISVLDEQFNATQLEIDEAGEGIADTQRRLDAAAVRTGELESELEVRAAALYVGSANGTPTELIDATDVQELGTRSKYGSAAADEDQDLIDELTIAKEELDGAQDEFEEQKSKAEAEQRGLEETRAELENAQAEQEALLSKNTVKIAQLTAQIEAQKRAEEEARARAEFERKARENAAKQAAAAAAAAAAPPSNGNRSNAGGNSGGSTARKATPAPAPTTNVAPAPSGGAGAAVSTAMAQLGKPYKYAGVGPNSFDCSGLTMFAWAAAGVRLPHSSAAQYASLPHVAQDQLQPGDLVFYGRPIHHVGIYLGGGQYVHAPQTGDVVKVASAFRGDYVGGARPG